MTRTLPAIAGALIPLVFLAACGDSGSQPASSGRPSEDSPPSETEAAPVSTPELDSIAAMGSSSATGNGSDTADWRGLQNSWSTGENPKVNSLYLRLLATHPALEGNNYMVAEDGSSVDDLMRQAEAMLGLDPVPDVVTINPIDNDIRCDGTDPENLEPFGRTLDEVLTMIEERSEHTQVYIVSQWSDARVWYDAIAQIPGASQGMTGTGPCDAFRPDGSYDEKAAEYLQEVADSYFAKIVEICGQHERCWTDGGLVQTIPLKPEDLTADMNHLTVSGMAKEAAYAWKAMPAEIRDRP